MRKVYDLMAGISAQVTYFEDSKFLSVVFGNRSFRGYCRLNDAQNYAKRNAKNMIFKRFVKSYAK
jgi:hypothetical protein